MAEPREKDTVPRRKDQYNWIGELHCGWKTVWTSGLYGLLHILHQCPDYWCNLGFANAYHLQQCLGQRYGKHLQRVDNTKLGRSFSMLRGKDAKADKARCRGWPTTSLLQYAEIVRNCYFMTVRARHLQTKFTYSYE